MAKSNIESEIKDLVDAFVGDLTEKIRAAALEVVQEALAGGSTAAPRRGRKKAAAKTAAPRPKTGKRIRRTAADVEKIGKTILAYVKSNPGQRLCYIAKALGMETKDARRPAFALLDEGKLKTTGQKGGTRYFAGGAAPKKAAVKKTTTRKAAKKTAKKAGKKAAKKATPKKAAKPKATKSKARKAKKSA